MSGRGYRNSKRARDKARRHRKTARMAQERAKEKEELAELKQTHLDAARKMVLRGVFK